jgi:DNA-binding transcriptional MerR regulator
MNERLFSREELVERSGISPVQLEALEQARCFEPAGKTGGATPVYDLDNLNEIPKLVTLMELGYSFDEIRKIRKKIGLPKTRRRRSSRTVPYLTVGELAQRADVSPRTIKYWEEKGIFEPETRTDGGFRLYPEVFVLFLSLIKDLQNFGYRLEQIREVADMFRQFSRIAQDAAGPGPAAIPPAEAEAQLTRMQEKIAELTARMNGLKEGIKRWEQYTAEKGKEIDRLLGQVRKAQRRKKRSTNPEASDAAGSEPAPEPA